VAWHRHEGDEARRNWLAVLALPENERRHRSTWSAFMLGRLALAEFDAAPWPEKDRAAERRNEARRRFRETREDAAAGLPDPLGLAAASRGWEARLALHASDYVEAVHLYLAQAATGDDSAVLS